MRCVGSVALPSSLSSPQRMPRKLKTRRFVPYKIASRLACIKMQMQACLWDEVAENLTKAEQLMRGGSSAAAMLQVGLVCLLRPDPNVAARQSVAFVARPFDHSVLCVGFVARRTVHGVRGMLCDACCRLQMDFIIACRAWCAFCCDDFKTALTLISQAICSPALCLSAPGRGLPRRICTRAQLS